MRLTIKNKTMNKDELLKIYSAYLPYKTPITLASEAYNYDGLTTILSPHYLLDWQRNKCKISLHLWDLSYLTKEIEHNCLIIKPIEYISASIADRNKILKMVENKGPLDVLPQWKFEKLLKFHFNVFNLPESEYINKATLTKLN